MQEIDAAKLVKCVYLQVSKLGIIIHILQIYENSSDL